MPDMKLTDRGQRESLAQRRARLLALEFLLTSSAEAIAAQRSVKETEFRLKSVGVTAAQLESVKAIGTGDLALGSFRFALIQTYKATTLAKIERELDQLQVGVDAARVEMDQLNNAVSQTDQLIDQLGEDAVFSNSGDALVLDMKDFHHFDDPPFK